ncbi:hypothetical protein FTV88_3266 [Heliorestis convoluta]|uniref:Uncharacterized protein n=1 Tax=Heliorestis convoluta TaxID=356322 RepID=A0A5Q2N7E1_9FIRM|nr:hypothetical protein FTV88_3266 [Heliorestis convoluta]
MPHHLEALLRHRYFEIHHSIDRLTCPSILAFTTLSWL